MSAKISKFMSSPSKVFYTAALTIIVIMLIGTGFDWQISQAIMDQNSWFGTIFQDFGLWPIPFIIILSSMVIINYAWRSKTMPWFVRCSMIIGAFVLSGWQLWANYLKTTVYYALTLNDNIKKGLPVGQANSDGGNLHLSFLGNFAIWIIIYLVIFFLTQIWLSHKSDEQMNYLVKVAVVATLAAIVANDMNSAMKTYWGRWRPYELAGNHANFTNWFQPNGANNHMSFPSGHTTAAAGIMLLPMFVDRANVKLQKITFWLGLAYCILMWASRVRVGAHFLTDATSGLWTVWFVFFVVLSITGMHLVEWKKDPILLDHNI
ncbi:phosphatase PAP2 family protein [Companilactobacillus furfuricola]|uniref:phosphatase PAP2 family protein n=1 Tax=Companilactobacillus furfuricola TaxID=1462575 RepID=UPI000F76A9DB|nr:phosphatase PAP2 family protein [Companilactobacillus furfuricola]